MQPRSLRGLLLFLLFSGVTHLGRSADKSYRVTVSAGEFDRIESVLSFPLPPGVNERWRLVDSNDTPLAFQLSHDGRVYFVLARLTKGSTQNYRLTSAQVGAPLAAAVQTTRERDRLTVTVNGKMAFHYQVEKSELPRPDIKPIFRRSAYIHP